MVPGGTGVCGRILVLLLPAVQIVARIPRQIHPIPLVPPTDHSCVKQESPCRKAATPDKLSPALSPKSTNNSPSPGRPFLRRQESHSVVCDNSPIRPRFPVPPEDHSCEGRNLTMSCATIRQFAPDSPSPRKTIPAKAGISQCRVPQFADSPPIPRPPEDHSCVGRNLTTVCRQRRRN